MAFACLASFVLAAVVGKPWLYSQMATQYKTLPNGKYDVGVEISETDPRLLDVPFVQEVFWGTSDELAEGRDKIISPYGVARTCELKIFPNSPYTGIYQSGGLCVMRLSSNGGCPVFIDGQRSQNIHVGVNVAGQIAGNETRFFKDPLPSGYDVTVDPNSPDFIKAFAVGLQESIDTLSCDPGTSAAECKLLRPVNIGTLGQVEQASVDRNGYNATKSTPLTWFDSCPTRSWSRSTRAPSTTAPKLVRTLKADYRMFDVETKRSSCDDWIKIGELWSRSVFHRRQLRGSEAPLSAVPSPVVPRVHRARPGLQRSIGQLTYGDYAKWVPSK
ncbi:hypothetical protein BV898_18243 [Hypsibius exemplaris]|uniref:Uncharacterized protein n=1 Tax=Hypsibius exemplaris TaxID=2072580 RepID=A0A9X6NJE9_HYPEX|nr:hypothetical protein BV898_18243 [Hypsibius exemplaris]